MATTASTAPTDGQIQQALSALIQSAQSEAALPGTTGAQKASARAVVAAASALSLLYAPATRQTTTITVEQGDTLWSLALSIYGDARQYSGLVTLNGLTDPRLTPGQTLVVPVL